MIEQKVAFVTGGSRGIGRAITEALLRAGFKVWIAGRSIAALVATKKQLAKLGPIDFFSVDLNKPDQISLLLKWAQREDITIDLLVNNAGIYGTERLDEKDSGLFEQVLTTNLVGPFLFTQGLLPHIRKGGSIINIASQLGTEGRAGAGAYCASKHGLIGLTRSWAAELSPPPISIRVNSVSPGWVATKMAMADVEGRAEHEGCSVEEKMAELAADLPLQRFITPEEVASLVVFLASDAASGITGQDYRMDT